MVTTYTAADDSRLQQLQRFAEFIVHLIRTELLNLFHLVKILKPLEKNAKSGA